ncbi:MAG: hypothetical protein LBV74_22875 [Tannerella sp.]|jgi:hypothetical protein|nr:hypothetical protein [Tannerella sp.]
MKIVNTSAGKAYHLDPETQLEVERTNPFFNEIGEQTLPVTIPDSDYNRAILSYPDAMANKQKPGQNIDATIQDGEYFTTCRQAIFGAKRNEGIETTFYMNEGAFFGRIPDTRLAAVFGTETIPGITTVQQGINFCRSLLFNRHDIYGIFPVLTKGESDDTTKWLNRVELMRPATGEYLSSAGNTGGFNYLGFLNEYPREEQDGDYTISIPIGCYITPFIRANYVLRRMFEYFGYTLEETFFEKTYPFNDMMFVNNTDDTLLNGDIRLTDLVPDILCSTLLNVYRKKFGCEFIPDELNKTVRIDFLNDIIDETPTVDLSGSVDGELSLTFPGTYKQLMISSKESTSSGSDYESVAEIIAKFPDVFQEASTGNYCRLACHYNTLLNTVSRKNEIISSADVPYYAGDDKEDVSVEVPDCAVVMREPAYKGSDGEIITGVYPGLTLATYAMYPYIGETQSLNSTLVYFDSTKSDENAHTKANNKEQSLMLAFMYFDSNFYRGTITNYSRSGQRLSDYSLIYNGPDGIFERFYRAYDNILRNSMHTVTADLLLTQHQKMTIPAHRKVIIQSQELLINKLAFTIGGKNEPKESEFYTVRLYEPVNTASDSSGLLPVYNSSSKTGRMQFYQTNITEAEYNASPYKTGTMPTLYSLVFNPDTEEAEGALIWEQKFAVKVDTNPVAYRLYTVTLRVPGFV